MRSVVGQVAMLDLGADGCGLGEAVRRPQQHGSVTVQGSVRL
jgi:hypothetical protein